MEVVCCGECGTQIDILIPGAKTYCITCGAYTDGTEKTPMLDKAHRDMLRAATGQPQEQEKVKCVNCGRLTPFTSTFPYGSCVNCGKHVGKKVEKEPEKKGMSTKCGCGRHMLDVGGDKIVHYKNQWWELRCLFFKVDKRMPKVVQKYQKMEREVAEARKLRLKFIKMKKHIRKLPCSRCSHPVGNRFVQVGDGLYCGACNHDFTQRGLV